MNKAQLKRLKELEAECRWLKKIVGQCASCNPILRGKRLTTAH